MNPLLFADWGRMNRLFTRIMWTVAAIMVCVVFVVLASAGPASHPTASGHGSRAGAGRGGVAAPGVARRSRPSP